MFLHGGDVWTSNINPKQIIDFSSNILPIVSPHVRRVIVRNLWRISRYPDISHSKIKKILANFEGVEESSVVVGNGSTQLIWTIPYLLRKNKTALILTPTFSEYERALKVAGYKIYFAPLSERRNFAVDVSQLLDTARELKPAITFICNPNNPTGTFLRKRPLLTLLTELTSKLVVVDEAFIFMLRDWKEETLSKIVAEFDNIIVLKSLTKVFGIPGLRVGYLISPSKLADRIRRLLYPWNINCFAQAFLEEFLGDFETVEKYFDKIWNFIAREKNYLAKGLRRMRFKVYPSTTNFILAKLTTTSLTSSLLTELLLKRGVLIRDCSNFRGLSNKFIRISLRERKDNSFLLKNLEEVLSGY